MDTAGIDDYRGVALGVEAAWPAFVYAGSVEVLARSPAAEPVEDGPSRSIPNTA